MPKIPIVMPQLGESIAEATIVSVDIAPDADVSADQDVIEVETNKATMSVTAPCAGKITEVVAELEQSYPVGAVLAYIDATEEEADRHGISGIETETAAPHQIGSTPADGGTPDAPAREQRPLEVTPTVRGLPVPASAGGATYLSPRMKARMAELGLNASDLSAVAGSGAGGRVTIQDFENFVSGLETNPMTPASPMRVAVADAMRRSWTRPIATVGLPIRFDSVLNHRKTLDPRPGPTLYLVRAFALALKENRAPAGRLIGSRIVHPLAINIGFAVEVPDGVLVPVMRDVDEIPLKDLIPLYASLVEQARDGRLDPHSTGSGIATVTNFGAFGLAYATPIPLPDETLVLGLGATLKRPHWDDEKEDWVPVNQTMLTLSFDHRVLDGGGASRLLQRIAALMEQPELL